MDSIHRSIASIPEHELVEMLVADDHWRGRITGIHGIAEDVAPWQRVSLAELPGNPQGDADLLLVPPTRPWEATAAEVKRVKVGPAAFTTELPNKLHEISLGIRQANHLAQLGFFQAYLFIFVVVDSRDNNEGRTSFAGMTKKLSSIVDRSISTRGLQERVGLVHFEFVQPIDDLPLAAGTYSGNLKRLATPAVQPQAVTDWIRTLVG